jgi:hypothetical protein
MSSCGADQIPSNIKYEVVSSTTAIFEEAIQEFVTMIKPDTHLIWSQKIDFDLPLIFLFIVNSRRLRFLLFCRDIRNTPQSKQTRCFLHLITSYCRNAKKIDSNPT